jgi:hypothetical protein
MAKTIGETAGEVWKYLNKNGESTTLKLKSALGITNAALYMAIGWLTRENKLNVSEFAKNNYKISLKK